VTIRVNSWIVCQVAEKSDPRIHTNKTPRHGAAIHDKLHQFVGPDIQEASITFGQLNNTIDKEVRRAFD